MHHITFCSVDMVLLGFTRSWTCISLIFEKKIVTLYSSLFVHILHSKACDLFAIFCNFYLLSRSTFSTFLIHTFRFGPRAADLIHLGAKFAPCMRVDNKIKKEIDKIQAKERETACCIRNDDSGCVQSSQADCSVSLSVQ